MEVETYRLEGKRYTVVLGAYPRTSLKVARTRHLAARTAVGEGQHPLSPKQEIKADAAARTKAALHAAQNNFRVVAWKWYNAKAPHRSESWRDLNRRFLAPGPLVPGLLLAGSPARQQHYR